MANIWVLIAVINGLSMTMGVHHTEYHCTGKGIEYFYWHELQRKPDVQLYCINSISGDKIDVRKEAGKMGKGL